MTDYSKLVRALRCKRDDCEGCDLAFFDNDEGWMCQYSAKNDDAADAIEALLAQLPKRGKIVRCGECKYNDDGFCDEVMDGRGVYDDWFCANGEREAQE